MATNTTQTLEREYVSIVRVCKIASERFFTEEEQTQFLNFMLHRFPGELSTSYIGEWASRIQNGTAWDRADNSTRGALLDAYGEDIAE